MQNGTQVSQGCVYVVFNEKYTPISILSSQITLIPILRTPILNKAISLTMGSLLIDKKNNIIG
jgi:hypothetical protein